MKKLFIVVAMLMILVACSSSSKYTVGVIQLVKHDALDSATKGFVDTLEAEFGSDVKVIVNDAQGESANCAAYATSFIADGVNLIMTNATPALQATAHATKEIPILGTSVTEYGVALEKEVVNHVIGGNVSGTSDLAPLNDQAQMIVDLIPTAKTVGLIYCSAEANSIFQVEEVDKYLKEKGLNTVIMKFSDSNDLHSVADTLCSQIDVLYVPTDNTCASNGTIISANAEKYNVPIISGEKASCIALNGVATLSIDYYNLGVETGKMAIKILKGEADISTMEIGYDNNPEKLYNKKMAEKYNIVIPSDYKEIGE